METGRTGIAMNDKAVEIIHRLLCASCGKQILRHGTPPRNDKHATKAEGGRAGFGNTAFCGYCAEDMDEYGLFPGEGRLDE